MTPGTEGRLLAEPRLETAIDDAKPNYSAGEAVAEANRCLYCHDAPCVQACPTGIDVPTFIRKIATGNVRGSARIILSANMLGYSCSRVCPVEVLCAGACVYNAWHRSPPIAIGRLQRFAVESALDDGSAVTLLPRARANGRKIACIGAGPASLACAGYLAIEGCAVTLFEKHAVAGGLNVTGVAPYKMHVDGALAEVAYVRSLGVEIRTGIEVGRDVMPAELLREFDAVFLAPGLGADSKLGLAGEDGPGVTGAVEWIERFKLESGYVLAGVAHAVVIGGGNTAIDAARALARLGVREVTLLYRRGEADMSGYAHELAHARHEGVRFVDHAVPAAFVRNDAALTGVRLVDGREFACDMAVVATGQARLKTLLGSVAGVELDARGNVIADPATGATGNPKVWVGGDACGGTLVVTAAQHGKLAARAIAKSLDLPARPDSPMNAGH